MKKLAHVIHHTHWDLIWYFTAQDAAVQFAYNMKELLRGFQMGRVERFFLDGQTAPLEEYLLLHPEDEENIAQLVSSGKLTIGPFHSQLDCFICNGESVVNNLRLGLRTARRLGGRPTVAYLPDSFGHSYDFPKIFSRFGINDFAITRGVGDEYGLGSEFFMRSNDGSELLVCTMIAGYGFGCYPFRDGALFDDQAVDYNKIDVRSLIDRLLSYSTLDGEFVFPLGFDQNPAMLDIADRIACYNAQQDDIVFRETTWEEFCKRVRDRGRDIRVHKGELFSTQYHRVHRSIFSARADIKALQDACERLVTYELQPMMSTLHSLGIPYDHGLIDRIWDTLLRCQTHSSATLTDETNDYIERETRNALNLARSTRTYLMKLTALSMVSDAPGKDEDEGRYPLLVFHTLPYARTAIVRAKILTKTIGFQIRHGDKEIAYSILATVRKNGGVLRRDPALLDFGACYYEHDVIFETDVLDGIGYSAYDVVEDERFGHPAVVSAGTLPVIENEFYRIYHTDAGVTVVNKRTGAVLDRALRLEDDGDEGDSFDYSPPTGDLRVRDELGLAAARVVLCGQMQRLTLTGSMAVPRDLGGRRKGVCDTQETYELVITLLAHDEIIHLDGTIDNASEQHRMRLVVRGDQQQSVSLAGTQYGTVERPTVPYGLDRWRDEGWFEEPSPTFPLLNHVTRTDADGITTVFTKSCKEYEFVGDGSSDIAVTLFRSYGAMGYPDLHRRPGRPSGLDYMVFETPASRMIGSNGFSLGVRMGPSCGANELTRLYSSFACDPVVFQQQNFDKSIDPITYFPTNPSEQCLPRTYCFLMLEDCEAAFGSLVVSDESTDEYFLRLYNNEERRVDGSRYESPLTACFTSDLRGERRVRIAGETLPSMQAGELEVIVFRNEGSE